MLNKVTKFQTAYLHLKIEPLNCKFVYLESTESTNLYAQNNIANCNPNEITVIYTYNQLKGRGQIGRNWFSGIDENVSMSIVFYPKHISASDSFYLLKKVSIALYQAIQDTIGIECKIKWPNDIYYLNHKLAGVLIQNVLIGKRIEHCIIGIGLNVNTTEFPEYLPNPISLKQITGKHGDLKFISEGLALKIAMSLHSDDIKQDIYELLLYRYHKWAIFLCADDIEFEAKIIGVDPSGCLQLERRSGKIEKYNLHEIKFVI